MFNAVDRWLGSNELLDCHRTLGTIGIVKVDSVLERLGSDAEDWDDTEVAEECILHAEHALVYFGSSGLH